MSRRLLLAVATSLLVASCATPEVRDAQKEVRREEAKVGVITRIVDVTIRDNPAGAPGQRINVLLMNEQSVYVAQPTNPSLRVGDRVRIEDTPSGPRVVPQ
jgi:hypothetical protein